MDLSDFCQSRLIITYITILYTNLDHYPAFLIGDAYSANTLYSHSLIFSKLNLIINLLLRVKRLNVNSYMKEVQTIYKVTDYIVSEILGSEVLLRKPYFI